MPSGRALARSGSEACAPARNWPDHSSGYLLDCGARLLAWNSVVAALFPVVGEECERILAEHWSMLKLLFAPCFGIAERLQNRNTVLIQLLNTFRHELQRIGDEPWVAAVTAELARDIP